MQSEKYLAFKSLDGIETPMYGTLHISLPEDIKISYLPRCKKLILTKRIDFNGINIRISFQEDGTGSIYSDEFAITIENYEDGFYVIITSQQSIDFCLNVGIIEVSNQLEESRYDVKFTNSLNLNFDNLPRNITRYFKNLRVQSCEVMFLDLELEII